MKGASSGTSEQKKKSKMKFFFDFSNFIVEKGEKSYVRRRLAKRVEKSHGNKRDFHSGEHTSR